MDNAALIGVHRSQSNAALLRSTLSRSISNALKLLLTTRLVTLDVNNDGVVELDPAAHERGQHHLEGIERTAMTPDEDGKVTTVDIEDKLTLVTVILVDGGVSLTKVGKNLLEVVDGEVSDLIGLLVGKGNARLKVLADGCELIVLGSIEGSLFQNLLKVLRGSLLHTNLLLTTSNKTRINDNYLQK